MPDALGKVKRRALHEDVMVRLAAYLREGKLKPGDRLPPERELAGRMHVSRATIREALRVMQLQSLIVSRHGAGTFIAEGKAASLAQTVTQFALHDIFEARRLLDPSMAELAARRAGIAAAFQAVVSRSAETPDHDRRLRSRCADDHS